MYFIPCDSHEIVLQICKCNCPLKSIAACVFRGCSPPAAPSQWMSVAGIVRWAHSKETWDSSNGDFGLKTPYWSCENFLWLRHSPGCFDPTSPASLFYLRSDCFLVWWFSQPLQLSHRCLSWEHPWMFNLRLTQPSKMMIYMQNTFNLRV